MFNVYTLVPDFIRSKLNTKVLSLQIVQLVRTGFVFIISVFLAQFFKDPVVISQYETLTLLGTGLTFFWVSGIMTTFLPFYYNNDERGKKVLIYNTFISLSIISVIASLAIFFVGSMFFESPSLNLFLAFSLFILVSSPTFLIEYILLVQGKNKAVVIYSIIAFSMQVLFFCIPLLLGYSLIFAIYGTLLLAILKFIYLILLVNKSGIMTLNYTIIKRYLGKSSPIMLSLLVGGSTEFVNGFIVKSMANDHDFAIFRYGAREFPFTRLMANALSIVISGEIASSIANGTIKNTLKKFKTSSLRLMHVLFPLSIVLLFSSKYIYQFLFTDVFELSYRIFNIYLLLTVCRLFFPQTILLGLQHNKSILAASFVELFVNAILGYVLMIRFGIYAVPFATLAAYYFNQVYLYIIVSRKGYQISDYTNIGWWIFYSIALWGSYFLISI